jgi:conjugative relaxase-like TrwC/TraI family protein
MLTISKPLSSGQAQSYHKLEFTAATQSYYKQGGVIEGHWQGRLIKTFGLAGPVSAAEFARLSEGKHPVTEEQIVRQRAALEYTNADGKTINAVEHRAGWDATFSAPKSVSLTALVGGDVRVREAHRAAVTTALDELERYTQARIGGNHPAETTGKFIAAKFEHDTARPVEGYAAPQLHTHAVIFNVTERGPGQTRAIQPQSLFDSQSFATAVYQSALTYQLRSLGYEIETGRSGAPEIKGYTQPYLDASSPRSQQIRDHLEKMGHSSPASAQIAAHATRDRKQILTPGEVLAAHRALAAEFGNQAERVIAEARNRARSQVHRPQGYEKAKEAVSYARASLFEREAVSDERVILREALRRGMGETTFPEVRAEFAAREQRGQFVTVAAQKYASGRSFTTPETIANERANVARMMAGQNAVEPMMSPAEASAQAGTRSFLNPSQHRVVEEILTSPDRIHGLQGLAGTGKTTTLAVIREGAERAGFAVEGFAPTSRAAGQLREAGIHAATLQGFLARGGGNHADGGPSNRHLYMLDESSLTSTRQMRDFLEKIEPQDRVLVIGDIRQHQGVDAGRPFEQMQDAGMRTSLLERIMRQKDPNLLRAVEHLAKNETATGIRMLAEQGRITEHANGKERIEAIARDYAAHPENTIIVSPDNRGRQLINQAVRTEMKANGTLANKGRELQTLVHRSDMTGADRSWAARYQPGDVLRYTAGSQVHGIKRGSVASVLAVDARENNITVSLEDGRTVTYDPRRLKGVNAYQEAAREFAIGDRLQFTAGDKNLAIASRDLGTVTAIGPGAMTVRMDGNAGRSITFDPDRMRHFDYGYAVTSHSSQGITAGRVLANIDTEAARSLINSRLAYVAISRASDDARIYTNDATTLAQRLATEVSKTAAVDFRPQPSSTTEVRQVTGLLKTKQPLDASELLREQGRVREYADPSHRLAAVALDYTAQPARTVIIAPDRAERDELTHLIRADLRALGKLASESRSVPVLIERQLTNRGVAAHYIPGDLIQYRTGNAPEGIATNSSARVLAVDASKNQLTIETRDGDLIAYDPAGLRSVTAKSTVYREDLREVAVGERIQFTAALNEHGIRNRDFATVEWIAGDNNLSIHLDNGKTVELKPDQSRHMEYGYAVANAKGISANRVILTGAAMADLAPLSHASRDVAVYISGITGHARAGQTIGHDPATVAQIGNIRTNLLKPNASQDQHEFDLSQGFRL